MEVEKDLKSKFLKAIDGDTPATKLWKYRALIINYPKDAPALKDKMLDLAIKNKLLGEYESVYKLLGVPLTSIPRSGEYGRLKDEMVPAINSLKIESENYESVGNIPEEVRVYFKLGEMLAEIGDHKDSERFYSRIIRRQTKGEIIREDQLLTAWGKELFYLIDDPMSDYANKEAHDYSQLQIFAMRQLPDKKKMSATLAIIRDIYRLTKKGRGKGRAKVFQDLKSEHFNTQQIMNNGILSMLDLGFLYSLIALAYSNREALKSDIKWSSKIELSYLQADYKKLFHDLHHEYEEYGRFNPTIRFVFNECLREINKRVLQQVLSAYKQISFSKIEEMTGIRAQSVKSFIQENSSLPYLIDPITQSVVHYEKSVPLYEQAYAFYKIIKERYDEKTRAFVYDSRQDFEELDFDVAKDRMLGPGRLHGERRMF